MSQKCFLTGSCDLDPRSRFLHTTHHPDIGDIYAKFHLNLIMNIKIKGQMEFFAKKNQLTTIEYILKPQTPYFPTCIIVEKNHAKFHPSLALKK